MAKDGLLCANPPSAKNLSSILMTGKKVGAAEVARAASQTLHMRLSLQGRLQIRTALFFSLEYWEEEQCSLQITALMIDVLAKQASSWEVAMLKILRGKILSIAGTYQATLSASCPIDMFSSSWRSRSNFRMQFRRHFPEYLAGASPWVILPLKCFFPKITLESSSYCVIHSSTVIPIFPSIRAISPPVLVPATSWKTWCGCSSPEAAPRLVRVWLIWTISAWRISNDERPRTPPPSIISC